MRRFWNWLTLRRVLGQQEVRRPAKGGEIPPPPPGKPDRQRHILHPGYASFDGGKTWHQCDDVKTCWKEHCGK